MDYIRSRAFVPVGTIIVVSCDIPMCLISFTTEGGKLLKSEETPSAPQGGNPIATTITFSTGQSEYITTKVTGDQGLNPNFRCSIDYQSKS